MNFRRFFALCASVVLWLGSLAESSAAQTARLAWDPNSESDLAGYVIYWGTNSGQYGWSTNVGNVTTGAVNSLIIGACYFAVTAYNTSGLESDFSNEVSYRVPASQPPMISGLPPRAMMNQNTKLRLPFSVLDAESATSNLTLSVRSSNALLLPRKRISFTATNGGYLLTLAPLPYKFGRTTITVTANDGQTNSRQSFVLTVTALNNPPVMTAAQPLMAAKERPVEVAGMRVGDPDAGAAPVRFVAAAGHGMLRLSTTIPGGITATEVTGNGTGHLTVMAPVSRLNRTLMALSGLVYRGNLNFVGADNLVAVLNDQGNTGLGGAKAVRQITPVQVTGNSFDTWKTENFRESDLRLRATEAKMWGNDADPDQDGRPNLLEFALGSDPHIKNPPTEGMMLSLTSSNQEQYLAVMVRQRKDAVLSYVPEIMGNGLPWTNALGSVNVVTQAFDASFEDVTYKDRLPISALRSCAIRLRVAISNELGDSVVTSAFGAAANTIYGSDGDEPRITPICPQVTLAPAYAGVVSSANSNIIYDAKANWALEGVLTNYYVAFADGRYVTLLAVDTNHLVISGKVPLSAIGSRYQICRYLSLSDLFGLNNEAGLASWDGLESADNVILFDAANQQSKTCFFSSNTNWPGWRDEELQPAGERLLEPHQGILVRRWATGDVTVFLAGFVPQGPSRIQIQPGLNWLGIAGIGDPPEVGTLHLYTGDVLTGLRSGSTADTADTLTQFYEDGSSLTLFYSNAQGLAGWRDAAMKPCNAIEISRGGAFVIHRKTPAAGFGWTFRAE